MMNRDRCFTLLVSLFGLLSGAPPASAEQSAASIDVPRWQPHELVITSPAKPDNPFQVEFSAKAVGPNNAELALPGYYDGDGRWKIRFAPPADGTWSLVTHSTEPSLKDRQWTVKCVGNADSKAHGPLRIDPQHPRHFIYDDGTRFYPLGYECDWLWALDMPSYRQNTLLPFLDKLAASGFNYVLLNTYAHDTGFRTGKTADDDYGPPALYPWGGSNDKPDHSEFNLDYWRHYDRVIAALHDRGMIAHIMIKVYNKKVRWPARGSAEDDQFFRWLIARYAAYPNVVWDFAKEAHNEKDREYKLGRIRFVRKHDLYKRLITVHDDNPAYESGAYDSLLDFRADQQHKLRHETMLEQRKERPWPIINVEFGYEQGPGGPEDKTYRIAQSAEEFCRRAWEVISAGGYIAYYYTYTAWDIIRPEDTPTGYRYFKQLRDFFEATGYWLLEPADDLISTGYCLAHPGREYVAFLSKPKPFTIKIEGAAAPLKAEWFHPYTAERLPAGMVENGAVSFDPPATWKGVPIVLHVGGPPEK